MHTDERSADSETGIRLDVLEGDRALEGRIASRSKRATGFGLWNDIHNFCVRDRGSFYDDCTVQVFATLGCDVNAEGCENAFKSSEDRLADFWHGMAADLFTEGFACAATDDDDMSGMEFCGFDKFLCRICRIFLNLFDDRFVVDFVLLVSGENFQNV